MSRLRIEFSCATFTPSLAIDLSPVPDAVQMDRVADNVVADPVRPHLQAPLADPLAFELLDLGVRPLGSGLQKLEGFDYILVGSGRQVFEVTAKGRGEDERKAGRHALAGPASREALLQILLEGDAFARTELLGGDLEALLELGVELLEDVVEVGRTEKHGGRLALPGDEKPCALLGYLPEE